MRITIVTGVFPPEPMVSARTSAAVAEELSRRGHLVHVIAPSPNRPNGKLFEGYKRVLYSTSTVSQGYTLTHCFGTFSRRSTIVSRLSENLTFGITAGLRLCFDERPDVIYSNSWAIVATGILALIAKLRKIPLVVSIQDVYPESLDSQQRLRKRGLLYRLLRQFDRMISRSAAQVIVISSGFRELYMNDRGVKAKRLHVIPNWGDDDTFQADPSSAIALRQKLGIPKDAFIAVYAGNVGVASNAEMLVDALAQIRDQFRIYLVIAGDGSRRDACLEKVREQNLERVVVHSPWRIEETGPVLQLANVLLLPTVGNQSLISIPSKLIAYFLSGRPVVAAVLPESDTGVAILESGAGWIVAPDSVEMMTKAIVFASQQSAESLSQMGSAGRQYALRNFTQKSNLKRVVEIVEKAIQLQSGGKTSEASSLY
jgi:glycosyltransferase involved in cell wall biosynthesis